MPSLKCRCFFEPAHCIANTKKNKEHVQKKTGAKKSCPNGAAHYNAGLRDLRNLPHYLLTAYTLLKIINVFSTTS